MLLRLLYINGQCPIIKTCSDVTLNLSSKDSKQQFSANQSIYQLSDKDRSVPDDIDLCRSAWTRLYLAGIFIWCSKIAKI